MQSPLLRPLSEKYQRLVIKETCDLVCEGCEESTEYCLMMKDHSTCDSCGELYLNKELEWDEKTILSSCANASIYVSAKANGASCSARSLNSLYIFTSPFFSSTISIH